MYPVKLSAEKLLTTLITALVSLQGKLENIDFNEAYKVEGHRIGDFEITKSSSKHTYDLGVAFCKSLDRQMFTVQTSLPLETIFSHFKVKEIWTDVIRGGDKNDYVDSKGNSPILKAKDVKIKAFEAKTTATDKANALGLTKKDTDDDIKYTYEEKPKTDERDVLCIKTLNFPFKTIDVEKFEIMRNKIVDAIKEQKSYATEKKNSLKSYHAFFPLFDKEMTTDNIIDLQTSLDKSVVELLASLGSLPADCSTIERAMDLEIFTLSFFNKITKITRIVQKIMKFFENPQSIFPEEVAKVLPTLVDHNVPMARLYVNESYYLVMVGKNETNILGRGWYRFVTFGHSFFKAQVVDVVLLALGITGILVGFVSLLLQFGKPLRVRFRLPKRKREDSLPRVAQMEMVPEMPTRQPVIAETILQPCPSCTGTNPRRMVPRSTVRYPNPQNSRIVYRRTKMSSVPLYLADSDLSD
jgi:hypothetical protein